MKSFLLFAVSLCSIQAFSYKLESIKGSVYVKITCDDGTVGYIPINATLADCAARCKDHGGIVIQPPETGGPVSEQ